MLGCIRRFQLSCLSSFLQENSQQKNTKADDSTVHYCTVQHVPAVHYPLVIIILVDVFFFTFLVVVIVKVSSFLFSTESKLILLLHAGRSTLAERIRQRPRRPGRQRCKGDSVGGDALARPRQWREWSLDPAVEEHKATATARAANAFAFYCDSDLRRVLHGYPTQRNMEAAQPLCLLGL